MEPSSSILGLLWGAWGTGVRVLTSAKGRPLPAFLDLLVMVHEATPSPTHAAPRR